MKSTKVQLILSLKAIFICKKIFCKWDSDNSQLLLTIDTLRMQTKRLPDSVYRHQIICSKKCVCRRYTVFSICLKIYPLMFLIDKKERLTKQMMESKKGKLTPKQNKGENKDDVQGEKQLLHK